VAKTTSRQRRTTGRVMHEFKHGELKSGRGGKGGKVKSRRQAIAIALKEAGESKYKSRKENAGNRKKYERKEAEGKTYQQEREGKSHVGARGRRESSRAMGGKNATGTSTWAQDGGVAATASGGPQAPDIEARAEQVIIRSGKREWVPLAQIASRRGSGN
jgi:Family of unknown function (DUF6496)